MGVTIPAVLPTSREDLDTKLAQLVGVTDMVQIDVVDGRFALPSTWPYERGSQGFQNLVAAGEMLPYVGQLHYEMDLMVADPEAEIGPWLAMGASRIVVHVESTLRLLALVRDFKKTYGHEKGFAPDLISLGLALNISTDSGILDAFIESIDYVQFMGIANIGKQGQEFDPRVLQKIRAFRKRHPDVPVQVDGGVSLKTAPALLDAGVSRLVVGSTLWKAPSLPAELHKLDALAEEYGIYE